MKLPPNQSKVSKIDFGYLWLHDVCRHVSKSNLPKSGGTKGLKLQKRFTNLSSDSSRCPGEKGNYV